MENIKIDKLFRDYKNNKLSHVYLIETNNQAFCVGEIKKMVKMLSCMEEYKEECNKCNLCSLIDKNEAINYYFIEPDGKNIKKEQVIELKNKCSIMPVMSKNNVYIVKNTEKLNSSSANTLLKFIEEPFDNCYGFFITNNKENVITTIKSRCEIISIKYENNDILDELGVNAEEYNQHMHVVKEYLYKLEVEKSNSIMYNRVVLGDSYKEKEKVVIFFKLMLLIYDDLFYNSLNRNHVLEYDFSFLKHLTIENIIRKRKIIMNVINSLNFNLNIDLLFDKFVIEIGEINE